MATPGKMSGAALKEARNSLIAEVLGDEEDEEVIASVTKDAKKIGPKDSEIMRTNGWIGIRRTAVRLMRSVTFGLKLVFPLEHGSTVFTRGETQAFVALFRA